MEALIQFQNETTVAFIGDWMGVSYANDEYDMHTGAKIAILRALMPLTRQQKAFFKEPTHTVEVTQEMIAQACDVMYWAGFNMCGDGNYRMSNELLRAAANIDFEFAEERSAYVAKL